MANGSFVIGQRFLQADRRFRLIRNLADDAWQAEDIATGFVEHRSKAQMLDAWGKGTLRFVNDFEKTKSISKVEAAALNDAYEDSYRQSYDPALWAEAQARLLFVKKFERVPKTRETMIPMIREVWEDKKLWKKSSFQFSTPPDFSSVTLWIRRYLDCDRDIRSLISKSKGSSAPRTDKLIEQFADDAIELIYMQPERGTQQAVHDYVRGLVAKENINRLEGEKLKPPSHKMIKRKIAEIAPYDRWVARYGKRNADIKFRAAGMGALAEKPLARASMDHCRLDLLALDDETGLPLGRPWLTLILDEATRFVLGYYLGFADPSNVSIMRALKHTIFPKYAFLERFPALVNGWDAWGPMEVLVVDNAFEFHGNVIRNGAGQFGIDIQFCPRRQPWFKGKIERIFGTMNTGMLSTMPGKTFSNIMEKDDYDSAKHAVIRLSTLHEIIATWIVDVYHQTRHRTLKESPAEAWIKGMQTVDRWLPESSISIETAFSRREVRRLTHKGIEFDSLFYNSSDLRILRQHHGDNIEVEIRVMDDDLGSLVVVSPAGQQLIRVPALDQCYANGMTRWQHHVCKRYQRRLQDDESKALTLFEAKERIRELIRKDMGLRKKKTRNTQAKFLESKTGDNAGTTLLKSSVISTSLEAFSRKRSPGKTQHPEPTSSTASPAEIITDASNDDIPEMPSRRVAA